MPSLPSFDHVIPNRELEPIRPVFFVPRIANAPQNPVMDGLAYNRPVVRQLPPELIIMSFDVPSTPPLLLSPNLPQTMPNLKDGHCKRRELACWDSLHPMHPADPSSGAFLSEQSDSVFDSMRYHVLPPLDESKTDRFHADQYVLLHNLKTTSLGISSIISIWDETSQRFIVPNAVSGRKGELCIDHRDSTISNSVMHTFFTIGTLIRRLDSFVQGMRRPTQVGPAVNAFSNALSNVLTYLRQRISSSPPYHHEKSCLPFTEVLTHYSEPAEMLIALSGLCHRGQDLAPTQYPDIDYSAPALLSHIYRHLELHMERQSPCSVVALFAYILTMVSSDYLRRVSTLVGYGGDSQVKPPNQLTGHSFEDLANGTPPRGRQPLDSLLEQFPSFFSSELIEMIPAAHKSLSLLRGAVPDHALLNASATYTPLRWFWTHLEISDAWDGHFSRVSPVYSNLEPDLAPPLRSESKYKQEISEFSIFDQDPGDLSCSTSDVARFLAQFPPSLPGITPTLSHLSMLVLRPLRDHAVLVSKALLNLLLSASDRVDLLKQMTLLRSFLLLTSPAFRLRLEGALLADSVEPSSEDRSYQRWSLHNLRRKRERKSTVASLSTWPAGLSHALVFDNAWPPVGADLSFLLRTVIIDSVEAMQARTFGDEDRRHLAEETELRLGFAIKDLPMGKGQDRWLNPLSIEALDFLYLDYKPPYPLEVVITPGVLSLYHRMFTFLLRLQRVECTMRAFYRLTRSVTKPVFPTLTQSNKIVLHFRFIAQAFTSALRGYVFDTVIAGNFGFFMAKLDPKTPKTSDFSDVFSLARAHHLLMNDILTACLLRTSQKAIGNNLRDLLELIIGCVTLLGEVSSGRQEEYRAALSLEELYHDFRRKSSAFMQALKGLDKNSASESYVFPDELHRKAPGGMDAIPHLIFRLDIEDWYERK